MPITPLSVGGRIKVNYQFQGLVHRFDAYTLACDGGGGGASGFTVNHAGTPLTADLALAALLALLRPCWDVTTQFLSWELDQFVGAVFNPVYNAALSVAGTGGGTGVLAGQVTVVMRDIALHRVKYVFLETPNIPPQHKSWVSGGPATFDAFMDDFMIVTGAHLGSWVVGRSGTTTVVPKAWTSTLNKRLRRRRFLV